MAGAGFYKEAAAPAGTVTLACRLTGLRKELNPQCQGSARPKQQAADLLKLNKLHLALWQRRKC